MKVFAQLVRKLDNTNKTNEKIDALTWYFTTAGNSDKLWAIALFTGRKPKRAASGTELRQWAAEAASLSLWIVEESWHIVGDLAETLSKIIPDGSGEAFGSLAEGIEFLKNISSLSPEEKKEKIVQKWHLMTAEERFVFNKMILGGFRLGVSEGLLQRALAKALNIPKEDVALKLSGQWDPATINWAGFFSQPSMDRMKPYPFCLAYPLEQAPDTLGDINEWILEYKWDGIRGQLILRDGKISVWSRGEEIINNSFPEFEHQLQHVKCKNAVLDGEIFPVDNRGKIAPFYSLQSRLGRKKPSKQFISQHPVKFRAYDIMELDGKDLRFETLEVRKKILSEFIQNLEVDIIDLSSILSCNSWEVAEKLRSSAVDVGSEGLMIKRKNSIYHSGRKKGDWYKWKIEAQTIDAVLVYAQRGHGRRANLYTDYTFALWKGDELVPFTKAYSGLTDEEIRQVDNYIRRNTIEKFGPVRRVKPELVFEIAFEGIQPSNRHKAGVALRFPRIKRWRTDKKIDQADHLELLLLKLKAIQK